MSKRCKILFIFFQVLLIITEFNGHSYVDGKIEKLLSIEYGFITFDFEDSNSNSNENTNDLSPEDVFHNCITDIFILENIDISCLYGFFENILKAQKFRLSNNVLFVFSPIETTLLERAPPIS